MLVHPNLDPVILELGPLKVHWYGTLYLVAFLGCYWLARYRAKTQEWLNITVTQVGDLLFYVAMGIVLGGRTGYVLFYKLPTFFDNPLILFKIWEGGMSFHGGLLGVLIACWLFARKNDRRFFAITDFIAPTVPFGLLCGRIGNFINGELWGKPTDLPWGMVFPHVDALPRHPSMLYEAVLEGVVLLAILWWYSSKPRPMRAVSGLFLIGYAVFRLGVEFVRQPDAHIGYLALDWLTMGHLLSLPMLLFGGWLWVIAHKQVQAVNK